MAGRDVMTHRSLITVAALVMAIVAVFLFLPDSERAEAQQPSAPTVSRDVTEIRFGVLDPPVVMQKDITESFPTNNTTKELKPIEVAGMYFSNGRLLLISDRHEHCVFTSAFDLSTMKLTPPSRVVIQHNEQYLLQDAEAITVQPRDDGTFVSYIFCSLSNDRNEQPLPMRRHLARFTFTAGEPFEPSRIKVIDGSVIREKLTIYFDKLGIKPYRTFFAGATTAEKNTYRWGNIEGIAFTPDGKRLLAGFRNPLTEGQTGKAIIAALENIDEAFDAGDASKTHVSDLIMLDLGDRGISDLCWDPMTKGYLISAGKSNGLKLDKDQPFPPNTLDSALFWWSGRKTEKPILFATVPEMKIESICRLGTSRLIAIASDEGDESESREQRQSVITVMDFTGFRK